jgi:two-component system chemotaxis sensor kinase CheA
MATEDYKDMFIEESKEHLNTINQSLLDFEKEPDNQEALNKIFRAAHTIKGMSATMNYDKIQKLSHKTEDTLDMIRNHQIDVNSDVIDLIFDCFDGIEQMERLEHHMDTVSDTTKPQKAHKEKKKGITENADQLHLDSKAADRIKKALAKGNYAYKLSIDVDKNCMMKSIRSYLLLKKLKEVGNIVHSIPDVRAVEDGEFDAGFELYYISDEGKEDVERIVDSVAELSTKIVTPLVHENDNLTLLSSSNRDASSEESATPEKSLSPQENEKGTERRDHPQKTENKAKQTSTTHQQSIRIGMEQLDTFMNLIGELVISKGRLAQIATDHRLEDLTETINTFDRLTTELQDKIMTIRMIPMKHIFDRFPRMVRDLAKGRGKNVNFIIEGEGIELDRTVLDEIGDPLVHLLRNCIDHGVESPEARLAKGKPEQGTVYLIAERKRDHVLITVKDDGAGIDPEVMRKAAVKKGLRSQDEVDAFSDREALDLLWLPGLSSAEAVTDVSGRGVGMDVVKSTIENLNGIVEFTTTKGEGTTFSLKLPLTMAIFKALFVGVGKETFAIPISNVIETISLQQDEIKIVRGTMTTVLRNNILPLQPLDHILHIERMEQRKAEETMYAVVIQKEDKQFGLVVDRLVGEQEITIKNIGSSLKKTKGIAGVTITGDGRVILVIDVNTLVD